MAERLTFMPSHRDTARRGRRALRVRRARNAPMLLALDEASADQPINDIYNQMRDTKYRLLSINGKR